MTGSASCSVGVSNPTILPESLGHPAQFCPTLNGKLTEYGLKMPLSANCYDQDQFCGRPSDSSAFTADHVVSLSPRGLHVPTEGNAFAFFKWLRNATFSIVTLLHLSTSPFLMWCNVGESLLFASAHRNPCPATTGVQYQESFSDALAVNVKHFWHALAVP